MHLKYLSPTDEQGSYNSKGWAIGIAVGIHIIVLCFLAGKTLSGDLTQDGDISIPSATISKISTIDESPAITPKPKIVESTRLVKAQAATKSWGIPTLAQEYRISTDNSKNDLMPLSANKSCENTRFTAIQKEPHRIKFFDNYSYGREVCFVVDCSGSMTGLIGQVVRQLKETIDSLACDQPFYIIFFGGNALHESGKGKMVCASPKAKEAAIKFAQSIKPSGKTDAIRAIKRAMEIKDSTGNPPAVIYFLTDGFELNDADAKTFCKKIDKMRRDISPSTKINTIGIETQKNDRPILEKIAGESGGQCVVKGLK